MSHCKKFCHKPWEQLELVSDALNPELDAQGFLCCSCWVPKSVGNVETDSILDVYNSPKAQQIRQSILDGEFSYCVKEQCPHIQNGTLPDVDDILNNDTFQWDGMDIPTEKYRDIILNSKTTGDGPEFMHLSYDESCNLSCPSCRTCKVSYTEGPL